MDNVSIYTPGNSEDKLLQLWPRPVKGNVVSVWSAVIGFPKNFLIQQPHYEVTFTSRHTCSVKRLDGKGEVFTFDIATEDELVFLNKLATIVAKRDWDINNGSKRNIVIIVR